jgi:FAD/FMN-containing dehydrogenase
MPLNANLISDLRSALRGKVITPHDSGYDEGRTVFYGGIDRRPGAIVRVSDANDVIRLISIAREAGVELAVRGGGHSFAGYSLSDGGIVLDLKELRALHIDVENRTAWAETGLTAGEYTTTAGGHGLATGFGDTASVGISGLTLGGGVGYLVRKHGLTVDSLLAADVVTADGQLVRTDGENHPDLFWAIRGGGGNFGVATRFHYRLHVVDRFVGGFLVLPATPDVLASFLAEAQAAPDELSTIANVMPAPPMPFVPEEHHGRLIVFAIMAYAGGADAGERVLAPFRKLAPIADLVHPMTYPEIYTPEDPNYHPTAVARTMFVDTIDRNAAQEIVTRLEASDAPVRVAQLRALGGAVARVPAEATAFAHRASRIMVNLAAFYNGSEDRPEREAWVIDFAQALRQADDGVYVNFLGDEGKAQVRRAYPGPTWDRLASIKRRYDPTNFFHLNQNIPPEGATSESDEPRTLLDRPTPRPRS